RLATELAALRLASHPRIVRLYDSLHTPTHLFLVTDLCSGGCLFDRMMDVDMSERQCATVVRQVAEAVEYLHGVGVVHRDIKLENVLMCSPDPTDFSIKLADFGSASLPTPRRRHSHIGTVAYMAPEYFAGHPYDEKVDCWAVGVLMYMLLSLTSPFGNDDNTPGAAEAEQVERITRGDFAPLSGPAWASKSDASKDLIRRLLQVDPNERLSAAEAMDHPWFDVSGYCVGSVNEMVRLTVLGVAMRVP
ncbi:kinase-like protein, partial [Gonapodya prolifera JEL478]